VKRREFIAGLAGAAAWPAAAWAQQRRIPVIGWLHGQSPESMRVYIPAFQRGLAEFGFVEGGNVVVEHRWSEGRRERYEPLAAELVRRQVSAIVADTAAFARVAKAATQIIPIVFVGGRDPVEFGLVTSFNRPGGNLTGLSVFDPLIAKRLDLFQKLVPEAKSIAMFVGSSAAAPQYANADINDLQSAASILGVRALVLTIGYESVQKDVDEAFATVVDQSIGAILIGSFGVVLQPARDRIISLATRHKVPTMFPDRASASAGALSSYGPDLIGAWHQAGLYAGRILNGERAADLPVMQPTKFELVINMKTAKALGLTVPETLLATADEVIE
jgi:putative ABC transport system substrate-binding protein